MKKVDSVNFTSDLFLFMAEEKRLGVVPARPLRYRSVLRASLVANLPSGLLGKSDPTPNTSIVRTEKKVTLPAKGT